MYRLFSILLFLLLSVSVRAESVRIYVDVKHYSQQSGYQWDVLPNGIRFDMKNGIQRVLRYRATDYWYANWESMLFTYSVELYRDGESVPYETVQESTVVPSAWNADVKPGCRGSSITVDFPVPSLSPLDETPMESTVSNELLSTLIGLSSIQCGILLAITFLLGFKLR